MLELNLGPGLLGREGHSTQKRTQRLRKEKTCASGKVKEMSEAGAGRKQAGCEGFV